MPERAAQASRAKKADQAEGTPEKVVKSGNSTRPRQPGRKRSAAGVDVQEGRVVRRCLRRSEGALIVKLADLLAGILVAVLLQGFGVAGTGFFGVGRQVIDILLLALDLAIRKAGNAQSPTRPAAGHLYSRNTVKCARKATSRCRAA